MYRSTVIGIDEKVRRYIQCRGMIKAMEERHKEELKPLKEALNLLSGQLEKFLDEAGKDVESMRTGQGTFYRSVRYSASLADPEAFMNFVKTTGKFELMDRKANSTAVREYAKEHKDDDFPLPPGCNLTAVSTIGVRKPGAKKEDNDE